MHDTETNEKIQITIDGKEVEARKGSRLLDACRDAGIFVPTLCEHSALPGFAGCRLCLVEQHKRDWKKLVTACEFPLLKDGEAFTTDSERIRKSRKLSAQLLLARAPESQSVLEEALGADVSVRLKGGEEYYGSLSGDDQHMNLVLNTPDGEPTWVGEPDDATLVDNTTVIRGDNVVTIET